MKRYFEIAVNGKTFNVEVEEIGRGFEPPPPVAGVPVKKLTPALQPEPAPLSPPVRDNRTVTSPLPGTVVEVRVKPGQKVTAGQVLFIIEAMKMENEIQATAAGVVREVMVAAGASVCSGQPLAIVG